MKPSHLRTYDSYDSYDSWNEWYGNYAWKFKVDESTCWKNVKND